MAFTPLKPTPTAGGFTPLQAPAVDHLNGFDSIDKRSLLDKASDFLKDNNFPGSKIGAAIGDQVGALGEAAKFLFQGKPRVAKQVLDSTPAPDFEKVVGDVIRSIALPVSLAATGGSSLLGSAATFGAASAAQGAGESMTQGKDAANVAKDAATSGALGAAAGGVSHVIAAATKAVAEGLPTRLIRDLTKQSKAELRAGKDVAPTILADKRVGTMDSLITGAQQNIERLGQGIQSKLSQGTAAGTTISRDSIFESVANTFNTDGAALDKNEVSNIVSTYAPQVKGLLAKQTLTLSEANQLRSALDRTLGDKAFLKSQLPFNKDVMKEFSDTLRNEVKDKGPAELRSLFEDQSKEIRLRNVLAEAHLSDSRKNFVTWRDILSAGIGAGLGGVPGVVGGVALERALGSAPFLTGAAVGVDTLHKSLGPILSKLEPAERALITSLISRGVSGGGPTQTNPEQPESNTQ